MPTMTAIANAERFRARMFLAPQAADCVSSPGQSRPNLDSPQDSRSQRQGFSRRRQRLVNRTSPDSPIP